MPAECANVFVSTFTIQLIKGSFAETSSAWGFRQLFHAEVLVLRLASALEGLTAREKDMALAMSPSERAAVVAVLLQESE